MAIIKDIYNNEGESIADLDLTGPSTMRQFLQSSTDIVAA